MPTLSLEPSLDDTKQLLCVVHDGGLAPDIFAPTREALLAEVNEQIAMLWSEYALATDYTLDSVARQLKRALLTAFTEVRDAAKAKRRRENSMYSCSFGVLKEGGR